MSDDPPIRPVGRDFGSFLPGVFWLNWFGAPYTDLIGRRTLNSVPGAHVGSQGVLVQRGPAPKLWDTPDQRFHESEIRRHLGADLFFSEADGDQKGRAPAWNLSAD